MIVGLGVDIVETSRIAKAMQRRSFVSRVLTEGERLRPLTVAYVAGRWAAKEAVAKAWGRPLTWHDVEVLTSPDGSPEARVLTGTHKSGRPVKLTVSISHEKGHAVAVAVIEGTDVSGPIGL
ncbi:MAG: holo-ACP synthase [Armatimonadetes bacterium]|nr:holo-ACP synthase [Armatimonadota bacterium]